MEQLQQDILDLKSEVQRLKGLILQSKPILPRFITANEVMTILDCSESTFHRLKREGTIKVYRLKRRLYCKYSEIIQALENGLIEVPKQITELPN